MTDRTPSDAAEPQVPGPPEAGPGDVVARRRGRILPGPLILAYACLLAALAVIIACSELPLFGNYPNQLARIFIQLESPDNSVLAEHYRFGLSPLPNLAMELVVPILAKVLPLQLSGSVFLWLVLAVQLAGVAFLHRVLFRRWSWWPLCAGFFLFHGTYVAGYLNFSLGAGLALLASAFWIGTREGAIWPRLLAGAIFAVLLYFCHLIAAVAYGIIIGFYELSRFAGFGAVRSTFRELMTNWAALGFQFVLPLALFLSNPLSGGGLGMKYSGLRGKVKGALVPLQNYEVLLDAVSLGLLGALFLFLLFKGWLKAAPLMAAAVVSLFILFAVTPPQLMTTSFVDVRFIVVGAFAFIAGTDLKLPSRRAAIGLIVLLAPLLLVRYGALAATVRAYDADVAEIRQAFSQVAPGSRVLPVYAVGSKSLWDIWKEEPARNFAFLSSPNLHDSLSLGVIERSVLIPVIHMDPGKHAITPAPGKEAYNWRGFVPTFTELQDVAAGRSVNPQIEARLTGWSGKFDYMVVMYPHRLPEEEDLTAMGLAPLFRGELVAVYRVE